MFTHLWVDNVLPGLHSHVLANLARVARWQLRYFTFLGWIYFIICTHREAKVVDFHLAEVAVLLELVLGVQVVVAVRAHAVDLVAVKYASMQYAHTSPRQDSTSKVAYCQFLFRNL